jgi:hypothetical protein
MDLFAGKSLEALNGILTTIKSSVDRYYDGKIKVKEENWDLLATELAMAETLVRRHLDAIREVCSPLSERGDLRTTTDALRMLIENDDLPLGYDKVRGTVKHLSQLEVFSEESRNLMVEMLDKLRNFQRAAFMIDPEKWKKGELHSEMILVAFENAVELLPLLEKEEKSQEDVIAISGRGEFVLRELCGIEGVQQNQTSKAPFEHPDEVVKLTTQWCRDWLGKVKGPLVLGNGVMATIGALQAQRPTG